MRGVAIALAVAAVGAAAPAAERDPLAGGVAGAPVDCIDRGRVDGPQVVDARTILYHEGRRRVWRNDLPAECPGLRSMDTMVIDTWGSRMCRNDAFRSYSSGSTILGPICRLGTFTPYDRPAGADPRR